MVALSAGLGALFHRSLGKRSALVIALVSASHWPLDLIVHRPDMPVLPGLSLNFELTGERDQTDYCTTPLVFVTMTGTRPTQSHRRRR